MPASAPPFEVDSIAISEYATQGADGNQTLVGVRVGTAYIAETPQTLPPWFITLILHPKQQEFLFSVHIGAPNGKEVIRIDFDYKSESPPADEERLVTAIQVPPIKFPGFGEYPIQVKDEHGETIFRHPWIFRLGSPARPVVSVSGRATVNPEFLGRDTKVHTEQSGP
ncbi:hypothetical protein [Mesorhizobium sp.]|uniref:DUF6941 family protein n=1 Tax=Mesorhizobium sp. TaxID=1871066 RepID=UPI000FE54ADD|nr:hypothetical protein [Mesorhizobium sp.]RWC61517.1 MAG: hypothetical protein EOS56_11095 [Mesorhizobium sp.]RWC66755.1 MAG: hypothetical protein EOS29_03320 [Mesorhizobium sp.]